MSTSVRSLRLLTSPIVAVLALSLAASPAAQPAPLSGFDDLVEQTMKDWRVPGLAIAVAKDGQIVFERGYGVRQLAGQPPSTRTRSSPSARRPRR